MELDPPDLENDPEGEGKACRAQVAQSMRLKVKRRLGKSQPCMLVGELDEGTASPVPLMRSFANTRMYCTISVRLAAFSRTLPPFEPIRSALKLAGSPSTVCRRCSFLTLSTDLIFLSCSSVRLPARTAPSLMKWLERFQRTGGQDLNRPGYLIQVSY